MTMRQGEPTTAELIERARKAGANVDRALVRIRRAIERFDGKGRRGRKARSKPLHDDQN